MVKRKMADIFGDADLFAEFDKQRPPSDKILKQKLDDEFRFHRTVGISNGSHLLDVCDTQPADYERRCTDDVPDCGVADATGCGESTNFVQISKLKQLENEVHRLTVLNIFLQCTVM